MLLPSVFNHDIFDDFGMVPFFGKGYEDHKFMSTDVKEMDDRYELVSNIPGAKKEDIKLSLKDGYLTIEASVDSEKDESNKKAHYIHKERYVGSFARKFYVGTDITEEDVKAKYDNGLLTVTVPKKEPKEPKETKKIKIE